MNNNFTEGFAAKLNKYVIAFSNNVLVKTIANGMARLLPVTIVGSIITLITSIPIDAYTEWLNNSGLSSMLALGSVMTNDIITVYLVAALSAEMAKHYKKNQVAAISVSFMVFFILTPLTTFAVGESSVKAFTLTYLGSRGMFVGMIVALFSTWFYVLLVDKGIKIKMHPSVPPAISGSFEALIPVTLLALIGIGVHWAFTLTPYGDIHSCIYKLLQAPLQGAGGSIWTLLIIHAISEIFWWFGIHGSNVTSAVTSTIYMPLAIENASALAAGAVLPHILNSYFINIYKGPRHFALALMLLVLTKSKQLKAIGKISIVPGVFGISEPMKFGIPMVFNPLILLPMTLAPVLSTAIAYFATTIGFMSPVGVNLPWSMPAFLSGFLANGWQGVVVQLIQFAVIVVLYYPFLKALDKQKIVEENETEANELEMQAEPAE